MSFYQTNKNEIATLHLISQIVGKIKLEYAIQEPQWAHVMLDITPRGFSTGLLKHESTYFEIEVNLIKNVISIQIETEDKDIPLMNGKTIQQYYEEIFNAMKTLGLNLSIYPKPQEMTWTTPFDEDVVHNHYDTSVAREILQWFQFAWNAEQEFIAPLRQRKVYPGLFWGTFDVSCILVYNEFKPFPDDSLVIERAAFDEHMIEFGFWLGDETYDYPTFFTLPYPFVEGVELETDESFPTGSYFSPEMAEYLLEMKGGIEQANTVEVLRFIEASCAKSLEYLKWQKTDHFFTELKMLENKRQ